MYSITEEKIVIEGKEHTVYGIMCEEAHISDVSTDKGEVERLVKLCNDGGLEPSHLFDVVADFIH